MDNKDTNTLVAQSSDLPKNLIPLSAQPRHQVSTFDVHDTTEPVHGADETETGKRAALSGPSRGQIYSGSPAPKRRPISLSTTLRRGVIFKVRNSGLRDPAVSNNVKCLPAVDKTKDDWDINRDACWLIVHRRLFELDVRRIYTHDRTSLTNIPSSIKEASMRILPPSSKDVESGTATADMKHFLHVESFKKGFQLSCLKSVGANERFYRSVDEACEIVAEIDVKSMARLDELERSVACKG